MTVAVMVITGASSGIGAAAAVRLSRMGHEVLAVGRSRRKLADVHTRMRAQAPGEMAVPEPVSCDLASLASVRDLAETVLERFPSVDVLVNNAAVQPYRRTLSPDGLEIGLAVNHIAPFLLTRLLADRLRASGGRVLHTSSSDHKDGRIDFDDLQMERGWTWSRSYSTTKLANILFSRQVGPRLGLPSSTFHPGVIFTAINRESKKAVLTRPFERLFMASPDRGADTLVWLATDEEGAAPSASYYIDQAPAPTAPVARDDEVGARLWRVSEELIASVRAGGGRS